jgi:hypothetical protein
MNFAGETIALTVLNIFRVNNQFPSADRRTNEQTTEHQKWSIIYAAGPGCM